MDLDALTSTHRVFVDHPSARHDSSLSLFQSFGYLVGIAGIDDARGARYSSAQDAAGDYLFRRVALRLLWHMAINAPVEV